MYLRRSGLLPVLAVAVAVWASPAFAQSSNIDRIVTFGASLSDSGNAFTWLSQPEHASCGVPLNVPPYDAIEDLVPSGPYAKGGHHFSNGDTWVEDLARSLSLAGNARPAFRNPGHEASNFAVGGARAVPDYPCRVNLPEQVQAYLAAVPHTSSSTLIAIEIGGNDVRDGLIAGLYGQDPTPYIANALGSLYQSILSLYQGGARRFLILNVPDVGKTPAIRLLDQTFPGVANFAGLLSTGYNDGLAALVTGLNGLPDMNAQILDVHQILDDAVASPGAFGFVNVTDACITPGEAPFTCKRPDTYAFWDGIHPTRALHAIVAEQALVIVSAPDAKGSR